MEIFPSLISSDLLNLGNTLKQLDAHVAGYHIDIMDNHFVPNLTWGPAFIQALQKGTEKPLQIHLMVSDPFAWLKIIKVRSQDVFIFHYESIGDKNSLSMGIESIRVAGFKVGIALSPKTDVAVLFSLLTMLDLILIMSVEPGFSGQRFMPEILQKAQTLAQYKKEYSLSFELAMDGGINETNIAQVAASGVTQIGVASAIFLYEDVVHAVKSLKKFCG